MENCALFYQNTCLSLIKFTNTNFFQITGHFWENVHQQEDEGESVCMKIKIEKKDFGICALVVEWVNQLPGQFLSRLVYSFSVCLLVDRQALTCWLIGWKTPAAAWLLSVMFRRIWFTLSETQVLEV